MNFLSLSNGAIAGIVVGAAAVVIVLFAIWYFTTKNGLISLRNDMEESFSTMDVYMKKRYDLIPNLVETCKGYAKHESRSLAMSASPETRAEAERELNSSLKVLMTRVQEAYPQLKADSQFNNLSRQLEQLEHEIAQSRKYYNAKVKALNNKIEKFPSSFVAGKMKLVKISYFELDDISERNAPKVSFDDSPKVRL